MSEEYTGGLLPRKNRILTARNSKGLLCYIGRDGSLRKACEMNADQICEVLEKLEEFEAKEKLINSVKGKRR